MEIARFFLLVLFCFHMLSFLGNSFIKRQNSGEQVTEIIIKTEYDSLGHCYRFTGLAEKNVSVIDGLFATNSYGLWISVGPSSGTFRNSIRNKLFFDGLQRLLDYFTESNCIKNLYTMSIEIPGELLIDLTNQYHGKRKKMRQEDEKFLINTTKKSNYYKSIEHILHDYHLHVDSVGIDGYVLDLNKEQFVTDHPEVSKEGIPMKVLDFGIYLIIGGAKQSKATKPSAF